MEIKMKKALSIEKEMHALTYGWVLGMFVPNKVNVLRIWAAIAVDTCSTHICKNEATALKI